jgi:hypothetical protein
VELGRQPKGGRFLKELCTDQEVGGLPLTDLKRFPCGADGSGEMTILPKSLGEDGPKSDVGINHQNASGMAAVINIIRLGHKSLI